MHSRLQNKLKPMRPVALGCHLLCVALGLWSVGNVSSVRAQADDRTGVRDFIAETSDLLDWAGDVVHESENLQARRVLGEARRLHERSMRMVDQARPEAAMPVARRARAAAYHAVRLARESLVFSERFQILNERLHDLRSGLQDRALASNNQQALELLDRAEDQNLRAEEQFHQGDAKRASRMLDQAELIQRRAAGLLGVGPDRENLDNMLERTALLIEEVQISLGSNPNPLRKALVRDAQKALEQARGFQARGMPGRALQMGGVARRLADQAESGMADRQASGAARRQIERWDGRFAQIQTRMTDSSQRDLRELLVKAKQQRISASEFLADGRPLMALRQIKLAHDLLDEVDRQLR